MTIRDVYHLYRIPPNLARHMREVTAVGRFITSHWNGDPIDINVLTKTLLLHDMGNIIKFKRPFLEEMENNANYWQEVQQDFIFKYGTDVHKATEQIVEELSLPKVVELLQEMRVVWSKPTKQIRWEARICEYADCCVTPQGITDFETRLQDLMKRYGYSEYDPVIARMRENAELVQDHVAIDLQNISKVDFFAEVRELEHYVL